ncbi:MULTISPECIES: spore coat protein [Brevibacillus]|jgi:spore coat protein CotF|uniref:Spore coat protein n=1 Tax=Brevibacillus aydinogluensis TaxID=927786 RepID=A0AA48M991_9BACL|nr:MULTISPECIES: spore coat protein [Bacillales]MBR8660102.1 spore coat protein [Brevibacillus sp. NL20B1]MDT3414183.1 spore coat protein CotF [Brevibacillus aydinogluensis]UFJ59792.1 spore coat protein [Anoxybacillus sediminis]CAJ1003601.1 Spore coat protein [Brevibacillus aydinogluensis]
MLQAHSYTAHEVMELHEALTCTIDALNTMQLYTPYIRDPELVQLVGYQMQFMQNEYNSMVHTVHGLGVGECLPYRPSTQVWQTRALPTTAAAQPPAAPQQAASHQPNARPDQMDDHDVASAVLGLHKAGAKAKMAAALESAHPHLRGMLLQGAVNCAQQAYDMWSYMQRKGYYPLATLPQETSAQLLRGYQPIAVNGQTAMSAQVPPAASGQLQTPPSNDSTLTNAVNPGGAVQQTPLSSSLQAGGAAGQPVNASQIFSSPAYRQAHAGVPAGETTMIAGQDASMTADLMGEMSRDTEGRQVKRRKKDAPSDPTIGH